MSLKILTGCFLRRFLPLLPEKSGPSVAWEETEHKAGAEGTISDCSEVGFPVSEESYLPTAGGVIQRGVNEVSLVTNNYI